MGCLKKHETDPKDGWFFTEKYIFFPTSFKVGGFFFLPFLTGYF